MGWDPVGDVKDFGKKVDRERRRAEDRIAAEAKRITDQVGAAIDKIAEQSKDVIDGAVKEIDHSTGVNIKPIVKAIAGPAHILVKIAEGHNVSEATTDWVVNQTEGAGEIGGIFGEDVEKLARTIVAYSNVPVLVLSNLAGDTIRVAEGKEDFENLVGSPLKSLLLKAHALYDKHAEKIPLDLKLILSRVVDKSTLNRARVVINRTPDNVAGLANALNHKRSGTIHAVTIDDIIVFSGTPSADLGGYLHWVHELAHVRQYAEWGLLGFASRYTTNYSEVEAEATAAALVAKPVIEELIAGFA